MNDERRKNIMVGVVVMLVALILFLMFLDMSINQYVKPISVEKPEIKDIRMEISEQITVDGLVIRYHGTPNNERFALCAYYHSSPISYPVDINEFKFYGYRFKLKEVTPMYIELTYLGKVEK